MADSDNQKKPEFWKVSVLATYVHREERIVRASSEEEARRAAITDMPERIVTGTELGLTALVFEHCICPMRCVRPGAFENVTTTVISGVTFYDF